MATREPPAELFYSPEDLTPGAPRLYVWPNGGDWRLEEEDGTLLSTHPTQRAAIDAALRRSRRRFSEILFRGSTGRIEWQLCQDPKWLSILRSFQRLEGCRRVRGIRWIDTGFRPIRTSKRLIPGRERPPDLYYDPEELDPHAPRLRIGKGDGRWQVRDDHGALLSAHASLPEALDAALERSDACFSEILVRDARGRNEWSAHHNPDWMELIRWLNRTAPAQREAAD